MRVQHHHETLELRLGEVVPARSVLKARGHDVYLPHLDHARLLHHACDVVIDRAARVGLRGNDALRSLDGEVRQTRDGTRRVLQGAGVDTTILLDTRH